ncbi:Sec-independent protein translocase protein TatB [Thiohalorhabdus methylotrophus]|uniref:Sec-independent protein translocase protein TatB n=1 Tax=Thiohalorhabdus methylotrophus TaxID=3242694 RepID=A0ABV4TX04_9GAMM
MFDIGFIEMLVIGLILLLVVGPERLPEVARTVGGWVHEAKKYLDGMKSELDRDLNLSELQRETRESFERTRSSLDDLDRDTRESTDLSRAPAGDASDSAGDGGQGPADRSVAAEDPEPSAGQQGNGARSDPESGEVADAEQEAADDMERELNQDQPQDQRHRD